jgi:hypothetical protein
VRNRKLPETGQRIVKIAVGHRVVKKRVFPRRVDGRRTGDANHWYAFRVGTRDACQRCKLTHAIRRYKGRDSGQPRVSIGGVGCVELVAAPHKPDIAVLNRVLEKPKIEVSRYAEHMSHAELSESCEKIVCARNRPVNRAVPCQHEGLGLKRSADLSSATGQPVLRSEARQFVTHYLRLPKNTIVYDGNDIAEQRRSACTDL